MSRRDGAKPVMQGAGNMTITQITIEIPNQPGQMAIVSDLMGQAGVNILALFVSTKTPGRQRPDPPGAGPTLKRP